MPVCGLQGARHGLVVSAGMFDNLSRGLDKAWDMVRKDGKLTADNIKGPMREIRRALLEADVRPIHLHLSGFLTWGHQFGVPYYPPELCIVLSNLLWPDDF